MKSSEQLWRKVLLPINATIAQAIQNLNQVPLKIILVVNNQGIL